MHREIKITQRMLHLSVDLNYSPNSATNKLNPLGLSFLVWKIRMSGCMSWKFT